MSELITQTARLVPYAKRPKQASGFVTAYYYEPMAADPGFDRGNLYAVIEVLVSGRASEEVANLIIDTIGDYYYNQPDDDHNDIAGRFEGAIRAANQELGGHVNRGNAAWIGKLSAVVAIQLGDELHVAQSGSGEAFLYRGTSHTRITTPAPNRPASPTKTFGSIASGQLESGDRILLATPALIHQVPLTRLQGVVGQANPNTAIGEITELLHGVTTERIAALIIEITTPELAALRVRSEQPSEIQLGAAETPLESAKQMATPIAHSTLDSTKKLATVAKSSWQKTHPKLRSFGLKAAETMRNALATRNGRFAVLGTGIVIFTLCIGLIWHSSNSRTKTQLFQSYQDAYSQYQNGVQQLANGQTTAAQSTFQSAQKKLATLSKKQKQINQQLKLSKNLSAAEPRSLSSLQQLITNQLNEIAGLNIVNPTTTISLDSSKYQPKHFEIYHGKAYLFDSASNNQLTIITLGSDSEQLSKAKIDQVGVVQDTTLSSTGNGIFILTTTPSIWFYNFSTDSLIKQTTAAGAWPMAQAIGSFGSSLYLLSNGSVIKYTKAGANYSKGSTEINVTSSTSPSGLAIDGSVYIATNNGIDRYFGGHLSDSSPFPAGVTKVTNLRSSNNSTIVVGTDSASGRIIIWSAGTSTLSYKAQFSLSHSGTIYAATYDPSSGLIYATTAGGKLLGFPYSP